MPAPALTRPPPALAPTPPPLQTHHKPHDKKREVNGPNGNI